LTKTVRVGVIGAGYWGPNIVRNLYEAPGAEAVAVADLSQERLDAISKRFPSLRVTTDYREVIGDPTIDAICIVTPVGTHRKFAEEAFAAGKHVFVEKPLAQSVSDAEAIVRAQERAGKTLMVGHTFVYNPAVEVVKGILDSDGIGTVYYLDSQRVNL
jgi:predicted dehydrogenase